MATVDNGNRPLRTGWASWLATTAGGLLLFEVVSGLAVTLAPFHPVVEWGVLLHTLVGALTLLPLGWYLAAHWLDYKHFALSHVVLLGYVATVSLAVCSVSGLVVTFEGLLALRISTLWRQIHLVSTLVTLVAVLPHVVLVLLRLRGAERRPAWRVVGVGSGGAAAGLIAVAALATLYSGTAYVNEFPADYAWIYGRERPFAPSLARTASGGAYDPRSLAGSASCGTSGCHEQILAEWRPSAHRWAAMDTAFQKIQSIMAEQNGAESTRYCGGCHDPISLFSGTKNIGVETLTGLLGHQEGVSCLVCHAIRETDLQGNANYVLAQPREYLWQWADDGPRRLLRDFLIRTYPDEHARLSKRAYKAPEYCAACHKQFIDQEVNRVGWVQLQNQYDNWKASHWNVPGDARRTVECRECHMPLVDSRDPAAGDAADYNRRPDDGRHRSHRFVAANAMMPALLQVDGWQRQAELTEAWLAGRLEIPEIADKWASGPIVTIALETPAAVAPGDRFDVRVVLTSNKV
ncbi:MAG TPA: multiheme c-type cytochrome, partial [Candidatus Polarisedimenticolaceae bacterium]|nr:multiheme c-type cytochrome [Candidatus Polarisedimenticolaceae bacterium]